MKSFKINLQTILMVALMIFLILGFIRIGSATTVKITQGQLLVNGEPFIIKGVRYSPIPIGVDPDTIPPYGDYFTSDYSPIYERDLPLLRQMGANTIRPWVWNIGNGHNDFLNKASNNDVKPIYVILTFWMDPVLYPDISSSDARQKIKADFRTMVAAYKNHPAVLMWSIGNELNSSRMYGDKLGDLFSLINEMAHEAHKEEGAYYHPVTTSLADMDLINTIAIYEPLMPDIDIWGANIYRGFSFGTFFNDFKAFSKKSLIITGFGIDAYDENAEDEYENIGIPYQAAYAESLWKEISANSGVCLGGIIRAYSDEWWLGKFGNTLGGCPDLDPAFHSPCGHPSSSDPDGFVNYEWFGIMRAKKNGTNLDTMEPRKVYTTLKSLWAKEETTSPLQPQSKLQTQVENELNLTSAFQSAEEDWKATRWEDALSKYKSIAETQSPYAAKAHIQIGKYYKYHARWNEAIREYESAIAKAKEVRDVEDAQTSIAAVHLSKGDYQKALSIFEEVISKTKDWEQVKYSAYWIKELKRRMAFGEDAAGCNTCGSNALKEVFKLKGIDYSDDEMDMLLRPSSGGASMQDIKQLAETRGLKAAGVMLSMEQLKASETPLIALLDDPKHYVVITGSDVAGIHIIDPENVNAPYAMPEIEFQKIWKGYALLFSETKSGMFTTLLSTSEMKKLKGKACYCCPPNTGTQNPHSDFDKECINPTLLVNTASLNLIIQDTDLSYSERGPVVEITRTYNADDSRDGPFGRSWTFNYNVSLTENPGGSVDIRRETSTIHHFTSAGGGNYYSPKGVYDTLVKNGDGTYSLKLKGSKLTQKFNSSGKLISITDRNGNSITFLYGTNSRLIKITDAVGRVTTLNYGANGKISSIIDSLGRTVSYSYDANNNLISTTDMAGNNVSFTYDSNSYMTAITTSKGTNTMTYVTSSDGYALKSITDPIGNVKSYGTYGSHYVVRITDANGNPTDYENNSDGYTLKITDAIGNAATYGYDSRGNRTSIQDAKGNNTLLTYDTRGNITRITDPLGNNVQFTYDSNDNLTRLVDPAGNNYTYEYDGKSNLTKITDSKNGVTTFTYNSYGELITLKDAKNNSINFTYDNFGNLMTATNSLGGVDRYTYDAVGRVVSHADPKGNTKSFAYDGINRLIKVTYPNGTEKNYTYDCCGLRTVTDLNGALTFNRDNINRLTSFIDAYGKTISYGYDKIGNLTTLTYPDAKIVRYEYDKADRLIKVTDWLSNVTIYEYDSAGNLIKTIYPNGSIIAHQYDNANRLKSILDFKSDATVNASYNYTLNSLGNRTAVSFYEPLNAIPPTPTINYTYDGDNRLLTATGTTFNYDNNGNLISKTLGGNTTTYAWDYNDMPTQLVSGGNTYTYRYDGIGNRIARIENGIEIRYVVDPSGSLSQLLAETDSSGNVNACYVYGLGLISKITPNGQAYFYHYDGIGSTIAISDSSGNIVNKYAYDVFGKVLNEEETVPNPFKYVGRLGLMDEGNGLLHMRARYYDSGVGRFINKDPIKLIGGLNMYVYVANNPSNLVDPAGLQLNGDPIQNFRRFRTIVRTLVSIGGAYETYVLAATVGLTGGWLVAVTVAGYFGVNWVSDRIFDFIQDRIMEDIKDWSETDLFGNKRCP